jgi:hypothetical protein
MLQQYKQRMFSKKSPSKKKGAYQDEISYFLAAAGAAALAAAGAAALAALGAAASSCFN